MAAGVATLLMGPALVHADGFNFNVKIGDDDEAHFHFNDHRHISPEIYKAANKLREAKHDLWMARNDYAGHKGAAIQAINAALDELRMAADSHRHG